MNSQKKIKWNEFILLCAYYKPVEYCPILNLFRRLSANKANSKYCIIQQTLKCSRKTKGTNKEHQSRSEWIQLFQSVLQ